MTIRTDSSDRLHVRHSDKELMVGQLQATVGTRSPFITLREDGGEVAEVNSIKLTWPEAVAVARWIEAHAPEEYKP